MRVTLRDLFWIVLIAALGIMWRQERMQVAWARTHAQPGSPKVDTVPENEEVQRRADQEKLRQLSDDEVLEKYTGDIAPEQAEALLLEIGRRGMAEEMREILRSPRQFGQGSRETARWWMLTALRRAEGKTDPLQIGIESLSLDADGKKSPLPLIRPQFTNVDVDRESFFFARTLLDDWHGSLGASGRHENWRIHLLNSRGELAADLEFHAAGTGYVYRDYAGRTQGVQTAMHPGTPVVAAYVLDPLRYVQAPPSGRYSLVLVYGMSAIADDRGLDGRMVVKSAPVPVYVENRNLTNKWESARVPLVILLGVAIVYLVAAARMINRLTPYFALRDRCALILLMLLAACWGGDIFLQKTELELSGKPVPPNWTMRLR